MRLFSCIASIFAGLFWLCADDATDKRPPWDASILVSFNRGDATDRSYSSANGTLTSGASIGNNTYASFDGTDDYIDFGTVAAHSSFPISISLWFNTLSQDQVSYSSIAGKYVTASVNGWLIMMNTSEQVGAFYYRDGSNFTGDFPRILSPSSYKDNNWHNVVFVVYSGGSVLYIDGAAVDTDTWTGTPQATTTATSTRMGAHTASGFRWKGNLDDFAIYNRELTAAEVGAMYATGRR